MGRFGTTTLLVAALAVGGMFELAKRLSWITKAPSTELAGIGKPGRASVGSARRFREGLDQPRRAIARPMHAMRAIPLSQRGILIPPTHGQFDSTVPSAEAQKIAQAHKKDADKTKGEKKKCVKKGDGQNVDVDGNAVPSDLVRSVKPEPTQPLTAAMLAARTLEAMKNKKDGVKKNDGSEENSEECEEEDTKVAKTEEAEPEKQEEKKPEVDINAGLGAVIGGAGPNNNNVANNELAGFEEWKARVLDQPNFKETVRLIEAAQSGQISSALFYKIVGLMLEDNRPEMRELGILAAGRTPSPQSFHLLVDVLKHEGFGSKLRQRAEGELNIYEQISYLWILESIMRTSDDVFSVVWATKQLEDSARRYLSAKFNRPVPGGNGTQTTKNPYLSQYNRFVAVLQELSTAKGSSETSSQAKQTLQSLQDLIKAVS